MQFLYRRPFGKEQEYFVQLFLEYDESMKLPTVGELLTKMFKEQNISFTEVQCVCVLIIKTRSDGASHLGDKL